MKHTGRFEMTSVTNSPGLPLTTADALHPVRKYDWNIRHVRWGDVLRYQHYGGLFILIPAVVITGAIRMHGPIS